MACMKLGSKPDAFQRQGQAWFCVTGLPSDVAVEVGEMSFHLHKFPLLSRSGVLEKLIAETSDNGEEGCVVHLANIPGGSKTFELVAKFCYGVKLELTSSNVVYLRCAAEHLEMTEEYGDGNLITETELFLDQIVLFSWKDSLKALQACEDVLPQADDLHIVSKCIDSLATKASSDPNLFSWPMIEKSHPMQSVGESVLWNGISPGTRPSNLKSDWWFEDVSVLSFQLYKRLISVMEYRGVSQELIVGSLTLYAKKYLPGLSRCRVSNKSSIAVAPVVIGTSLSDNEQKLLLEDIDSLLPVQKGNTSTKFLFGMLRTAMILHASSSCIQNLERRIGMQLDQATLEDLLMPTFSYSMETLYNVECVQRILDHFLEMDQATGEASPFHADDDDHLMNSPSLTPITMVAKLIDGYLAEISSDINLKLSKFMSLAGAVPDYARPLDDGLYRAIDIYLKAHPRLADSEKEQLCRLMDCQKLSLEACTHAAQNERLPLRVVVQILFFEQLQLRTSVAGCFLVSENLDTSRQLRSGFVGSNEGGGLTTTVKDNQVLKVGMDSMRMRVSELEKECTDMKQEIEKFSKGKANHVWNNVSKMFGFRMKSQMCSAGQGSVSNQHKDSSSKTEKVRIPKSLTKYE